MGLAAIQTNDSQTRTCTGSQKLSTTTLPSRLVTYLFHTLLKTYIFLFKMPYTRWYFWFLSGGIKWLFILSNCITFKKNNNNCVPTNLNISTFQYKAFLDFQYKAFIFTLKSEKIIIFLVMYMQLTKKCIMGRTLIILPILVLDKQFWDNHNTRCALQVSNRGTISKKIILHVYFSYFRSLIEIIPAFSFLKEKIVSVTSVLSVDVFLV